MKISPVLYQIKSKQAYSINFKQKERELKDDEKRSFLGYYSDEEIEEFFAYLDKNPKIKEVYLRESKNNGIIDFNKLQNQNGYEISITRTIHNSIKDYTITIQRIIDNQGNVSISRSENCDSIIRAKYKNDGNLTIVDITELIEVDEKGEKGSFFALDESFELIVDKNQKPKSVIHTKPSNILKGAFDIKEYTLSDYPEEMDIIEEIKKGNLTGGKKISSITKEKDGTIKYVQNYSYNDTMTNIVYSEKYDENGLFKNSYSIVILDENAQPILNHRRTLEQLNGNVTISTIDDKAYTITYTEDKILIADINGNTTEIDLNAEETMFSRDENLDNEEIDEIIRKIPADILLEFNKRGVQVAFIKDEIYSGTMANCNYIETGTNIFSLTHEFGHLIDCQKEHPISQNKELINIYIEEYERFKKIKPKSIEEIIIRYFTPTGGTLSLYKNSSIYEKIKEANTMTGLSEIIAETNALLYSYGSRNEAFNSRTNYLIRFFPKTIAKAASLLTTI